MNIAIDDLYRSTTPPITTEPILPDGVWQAQQSNIPDEWFYAKKFRARGLEGEFTAFVWDSWSPAQLRAIADHMEWREQQSAQKAVPEKFDKAIYDVAMRHLVGTGLAASDQERIADAIQAALAAKETK